MRHRTRSGLTVVAGLASSAVLVAPAAAQAPAAPQPNTVSAIGTGTVKPTPTDRNDNASIARAVAEARRQAVPAAVAEARRHAVEIAFAGGLTVGAVVAMAEGSQSPFYGPFDQSQGTFGPGRFCGNVPRWKTTRAPSGRIISRKRIGTRRTCRVPSRVTAVVTVTYAAAPRA